MDNNDVTWTWEHRAKGESMFGERSDQVYSAEIYTGAGGAWIWDVYKNIKGYPTFVQGGTSSTEENAKTDVENYARLG